jgi:hypothetical protein
MWTTYPGEAKGNLTLRAKGIMQAGDVLKYHPEIQAQLDEIVRQGWKYLYVEILGTAVAEVAVGNLPYHIRQGAAPGMQAMGRSSKVLEITIDRKLLNLKDVPDVQEFRVNVCSKNFPRAATVNLAKGIVTYLHDPFWKWEKGWENDKKKISDAKEVYEIATWLIDVKKFKLIDAFQPERYRELAENLKPLLQ